MFAIKVRSRTEADEKLGAIRIRSSIRHRQETFVRMWDPYRLICKLGTVNALRLRAIIPDNDLAALHHETRYDSIEDASSVVQVIASLPRAQSSKVLDRPWHLLLKEFHNDTSFRKSILALCSNLDVHENLRVTHAEARHSISLTLLSVTVKA